MGGLQPYKVLTVFVTETESTGRRLSQTVWIRDELLGLKQGLKPQRKKIKTSYNILHRVSEQRRRKHSIPNVCRNSFIQTHMPKKEHKMKLFELHKNLPN